MSTLVLRRVAYGKSGVPAQDREFQVYPGSPVGNKQDWLEYARKRDDLERLIFIDQKEKEVVDVKKH